MVFFVVVSCVVFFVVFGVVFFLLWYCLLCFLLYLVWCFLHTFSVSFLSNLFGQHLRLWSKPRQPTLELAPAQRLCPSLQLQRLQQEKQQREEEVIDLQSLNHHLSSQLEDLQLRLGKAQQVGNPCSYPPVRHLPPKSPQAKQRPSKIPYICALNP